MSTVTMRYFIAEGERAAAVAEEGLRRANEARANRKAFWHELAADCFYERRHCVPIGVGFENGGGEAKPGFLRPTKSDGFWIYKPDKRSTLGKDILKRLATLAEFNFSDYACREFEVDHMVAGASERSRTGMAMFLSVAGYMQEKLVFKIPFGGDGDSDIKIPDDFREIKKSEFIAITEESGS